MKLRKAVLTVGSVILLGCGGGTSGTGGFTTGFEKDRKIETLSSAEIASTCERFSSQVRSRFTNDLVCPGLAAIGASAYPVEEQAAACANIETVCRDEPNEYGDLDSCPLTRATAGCQIQVETLDDCLDNFFDETEDSLGQLSCDSKPDKEVLDKASYILFYGFPSTSSCDLLSKQCPKFLEKLRNS